MKINLPLSNDVALSAAKKAPAKKASIVDTHDAALVSSSSEFLSFQKPLLNLKGTVKKQISAIKKDMTKRGLSDAERAELDNLVEGDFDDLLRSIDRILGEYKQFQYG